MGRMVKDWTDARVADFEVAPHRYTWTGFVDPPDGCTIAEWKAALPYKPGEVVYVDIDGQPVKALIYLILSDRNVWGERRALYRVQLETKTGAWSKMWINAWASQIQRGYQRAGLAPDIPAD